MMPNDILIKYNGTPVNTLKALNDLKSEAKSDSVEVVILREQKELKLKCPTGAMGVYLNELLPDIKYKPDAVVIEGFPRFNLADYKINKFLGCVELVTNHLGIKKDYVEINGISGAAFRLHFCKNWCSSSPNLTCGYYNGEDALNALGLEYKSYSLSSDGKNKPEIKKAIMESIDKKIPVIAIDIRDIPGWGLITGYQNNGEEFLCRTYFDKRNSYEIAQKFPWALYIITGRKPMAKDVDLYKQSFKTVLANLTTEMYDEYYSGLAAFDKWIERLSKDDFAKMDSQKFHNAVRTNRRFFEVLMFDRDDAVAYLESIAVKMPEISQNLTELANIYKEEAKILLESDIPDPDIIKNSSEWTVEMRQDEIAPLQKAKEKKESALKIWRETVKTEGENK